MSFNDLGNMLEELGESICIEEAILGLITTGTGIEIRSCSSGYTLTDIPPVHVQSNVRPIDQREQLEEASNPSPIVLLDSLFELFHKQRA